MMVEFLLPPKERTEIDDIALSQYYAQTYDKFYVSMDQSFVVNCNGVVYVLTIQKVMGA